MHAEAVICCVTGGNRSTCNKVLPRCEGSVCCACWPPHTHLEVLPDSCKAAVDAPHGVLHSCKLTAELCLDVLSYGGRLVSSGAQVLWMPAAILLRSLCLSRVKLQLLF